MKLDDLRGPDVSAAFYTWGERKHTHIKIWFHLTPPSILHHCLSYSGLQWGMEPFPVVIGREAGYTWTGKQWIHSRNSFTPTVTLEFPVHQICMSLEETHADTENRQTPHRDRDSNPGPSCCEATVLNTEPPNHAVCSLLINDFLRPRHHQHHQLLTKTPVISKKNKKFQFKSCWVK